ncbi:MAG: C39 family peptidase [Patescibacteria group bacterium]
MRKIFLTLIVILILIYPSQPTYSAHYAGEKIGYILLQVEANGEAWYVYPEDGKSYYLGRPSDAFNLMKELSLGASHEFIINTKIFPARLSGMILLDVEANGEAYYIYPANLEKYYLGRPTDAFKIMRELSLGITNENLANIPVGEINMQKPDVPKAKNILLKVPFTAQAPFGEWDDQRQQDGCEEASSLMAVKWAKGENLTKQESKNTILNASDYLLEKYKEYRDISSADIIKWIFNDYFNFNKVALKKDITISDIIYELEQGNLVITPMNGQIMHNPYYTAPGPPRHMIVIRGYDPKREVFITNDPGTRQGELFEYPAKILYDAIRDYPTGYHEIIEKIEKNMIVVWR